ncbi:GD17005 [Drosophila simulans]|uniref:GD17005 n=1 Tax=Drosophila simulans TaxID=7240 RepID=B4R2R5_DROSI|nr:GD17005 [Drosophila simulans]
MLLRLALSATRPAGGIKILAQSPAQLFRANANSQSQSLHCAHLRPQGGSHP